LTVGLTLLHDPVLQGTVADPQLQGFDPGNRAFLVLERNKAGLAFDKNKPAEEVLAAAAEQARVSQPASAGVYSLATVTNVQSVGVSTAPRPVRGPAVRPAAMAGRFYEADPAKLARMVNDLLTETGAQAKDAKTRGREIWPAAMVPHAGLQFSGRIAADVLRRIEIPQTVIVIGPSHTGQGMEWAVAPQQTWAMPGFEVQSDFMLARKLCQAIPGLEMDALAHQQEHAIEVELPFIAQLAPEAKVIGITIGHGDLESCRRFAKGLAELIRAEFATPPATPKANDGAEKSAKARPLLLVSSDMNHFASDAETRRLDALALAALESGDPAELFNTVNRHNISMCGVLPAVIVLETLRLLGTFKKALRTGYSTTADVTGDKCRVVGYAGMLLG
jgi:predicted class III extradiol MEMO1 family dioxygenase